MRLAGQRLPPAGAPVDDGSGGSPLARSPSPLKIPPTSPSPSSNDTLSPPGSPSAQHQRKALAAAQAAFPISRGGRRPDWVAVVEYHRSQDAPERQVPGLAAAAAEAAPAEGGGKPAPAASPAGGAASPSPSPRSKPAAGGASRQDDGGEDRPRNVPRLPDSAYRHRVEATKPHAYSSVLPLVTPLETQAAETAAHGGGDASAPWLQTDVGDHRALSAVVMRDFRMRALLSTINDSAALLARPIPSMAGELQPGAWAGTRAPSPVGSVASRAPSQSPAQSPAAAASSPGPDRRTVFALHQRAAALLQVCLEKGGQDREG